MKTLAAILTIVLVAMMAREIYDTFKQNKL